MDEIKQLKISDIVKNPYQPRLIFDEEKLQELAQSIRENGVLQPIIVRKSKLIGYELLAGERRFQAAQIAGLTEIPAIVRDYSDQEMMTLSILENLQREDMTAVEEARSLANLSQKLGLSHGEIAQKLGKSRAYVSNSIRLLALPEPLLSYLEAGKLSSGHARTLLALDSQKEQLQLADRSIREKLSVRELEKLIYQPQKKKKKDDAYKSELENELKKYTGNRVKLTANKQNKGSLLLHFDNLDQLERLIEKLKK